MSMDANREPLLKGKVQYSWPPYTNYFRSASFDNSNIIYFFTKQATYVYGRKQGTLTEREGSVQLTTLYKLP